VDINRDRKMSKERTRATFRVVIPGLVAGGLCGAAVGLGLIGQAWGIAAAIGVALYIGLSVLRLRNRFN
jgi:uncharacterized membrane protein (UPF0136 family)